MQKKCPKCFCDELTFVIDSDLQWFCEKCNEWTNEPLLSYTEKPKEQINMFQEMPGLEEGAYVRPFSANKRFNPSAPEILD